MRPLSDATLLSSEDDEEIQQLVSELYEQFRRSAPISNVVQFCADFFANKLVEQEEENNDDDDDDDDDDALGALPALSGDYNFDRRVSVSAESITPAGHSAAVLRRVPKSRAQWERIWISVGDHFLFRDLDEEQYKDVVDAMVEKSVCKGETVIEQGAVGDYFYIVEKGSLDCLISGRKVTEYGPGESFGELALMYDAPRAATLVVTSEDPTTLWALDRITFRTILMENASSRRKLYEFFLTEVPLLKSLKPCERHKIADAVESVTFEDKEQVVVLGEVGERFYMIESGEAIVYQNRRFIRRLEKGAYFGELALLNDKPRTATVVAHGRLKCATLDKKAFNRLLGPVLDILKRNSENYYEFIDRL
ncbi:cyclic nucleotide-binding-like protein [Dichotomocladium elegans]|nr:cyclic nucleotide-binding-like protein [Dichotomocladium elegans]